MEVAEAQREMREVYLNAAPGRRRRLLAGVLVVGGVGLAFAPTAPFALGAWLTAGVLTAFAAVSVPRAGGAAVPNVSGARHG
jgi:hypothetical protein